MGVGDDIAVLGEDNAGTGAVLRGGFRFNGYHRGETLVVNLRIGQGDPCVRLEGQRDAGARLSPGDRGGIRAVLLNLALPSSRDEGGVKEKR